MRKRLFFNKRLVGEYDAIVSPILSYDASQVAFFAKRANQYSLIVAADQDTKEYPAGKEYRALAFSPDSKHTACIAREDGKDYFVYDGIKEARGYDHILKEPIFYGGRAAYLANTVSDASYQVFMVTADGLSDAYTSIESVVVSPDGKRLAYVGKKGRTSIVMVYGRKAQSYPDDDVRDLTFSPDSKRLARDVWFKRVANDERTANSGFQSCVVLDGQESQAYDDI